MIAHSSACRDKQHRPLPSACPDRNRGSFSLSKLRQNLHPRGGGLHPSRKGTPTVTQTPTAPPPLTQHGEVELILPVAAGESRKLADVDPFVIQLQSQEADGAILGGGALEEHPLLVGGQDGDTHVGVEDGHVLLGAVGGLLPRDLRDLHIGGVGVGEAAMQDHVGPDEPGDRVVDKHRLSPEACEKRGREGGGEEREDLATGGDPSCCNPTAQRVLLIFSACRLAAAGSHKPNSSQPCRYTH